MKSPILGRVAGRFVDGVKPLCLVMVLGGERMTGMKKPTEAGFAPCFYKR